MKEARNLGRFDVDPAKLIPHLTKTCPLPGGTRVAYRIDGDDTVRVADRADALVELDAMQEQEGADVQAITAKYRAMNDVDIKRLEQLRADLALSRAAS